MENATYFRSLVGGLNYLYHTRLDIAFSVGVVSRFMHNPSKLHLGHAKRILRYILGIKSTSGFLFNLRSGAISWSSKKQEVVALSIQRLSILQQLLQFVK
ncbi:hypothetical protein T459_20404 [Capsicum annuum]|uniref:Retrovirus-related Pol polyprotein from transposon TNT 1-94 n=1 Tax=Capsicum annuum TaxID=4072 RepID=A0A2G2Z4D8_CAPAN|nr:hypothetical protein T459_20404 [Capsicum annuum]